MLPIATSTSACVSTGRDNSMFAAINDLNNIGTQKFLTNVGNFSLNVFARDSMTYKHDLSFVASYAESAVSYFVDMQLNNIANFYYV
jgi:hypothetical protein